MHKVYCEFAVHSIHHCQLVFCIISFGIYCNCISLIHVTVHSKVHITAWGLYIIIYSFTFSFFIQEV